MPRWSDYGNARSQSGRGTLLFRRIWMIQLTRTVRMAICGCGQSTFAMTLTIHPTSSRSECEPGPTLLLAWLDSVESNHQVASIK